MSFLSSLKSMFSGSGESVTAAKVMPSEEYEGFEIIPTPAKEGGQYRLNGIIRKGEREHQIIRADVFTSSDTCAAETIRKSKVLIDQMGDRLFN